MKTGLQRQASVRFCGSRIQRPHRLPLRRPLPLKIRSEISDEVTIRRRPPAGTTAQQCGPFMFEMKEIQEDSRPKNILEEIVWYKNKEVEEMRQLRPVQSLIKIVSRRPPTRDFKGHLLKAFKDTNRPGLIAEVKKASPSRGVLRSDFDPVKIAKAYERGGASCLSVLTDKKYFQGGFENLKAIFESGVTCPLLCKEFIIDAYQLFLARVNGADAVLLIAAVLPNKDMEYFTEAASNLGMQCLIEVHDEKELERVSRLSKIDNHLVGINNRNLETFEVDLNTTAHLLSTSTGQQMLERGIPFVGESGIYTSDDIDVLQKVGCRAVLVGESLVKEADQESAVAQLLGRKQNGGYS